MLLYFEMKQAKGKDIRTIKLTPEEEMIMDTLSNAIIDLILANPKKYCDPKWLRKQTKIKKTTTT